jgi:hypothetical protein
VKTVPIAWSGYRDRSDREERARLLILLLRLFLRSRDCEAVQNAGCGSSMVDAFDEIRLRPGLRFS